MESNCIPCIMAGIVNIGMSPKDADDRSPYKKPLNLFMSRSRINR